jgi:hypothetical protein
MAITDNAIVVRTIPFEGDTWSIAMYSADMSGAEELKAAVSGSSHYIMYLELHTASSITLSIGADETVAGTMDYTYIGPITFTAAGPHYIRDFTQPSALPLKGFKLPSGSSLMIDASGAGPVFVYAEGKTCVD